MKLPLLRSFFFLLFALAVAQVCVRAAAEIVVSPGRLGLVGDGRALETKAFQSLIDRAEPGSVIKVVAGRYVVGTLKLKSDLELHLGEGTELLGSKSIDDYARDVYPAIEAPAFDECLIFAENASNVKLSGKGGIDGRGHRETFPVKLEDGSLGDRPMLIRFVNCQNVTFEGITLKNAASWCTHMIDCDNLIFRGITIDSHVNTNNDGLDLDGCKNVLIEDCNIVTGDDSICPKSTSTRLCENFVVRNCRVVSHTSAFKLGTSSRGGFRNMLVTDCDFSDTRMGAIKLMIVDGGLIEGIRIQNIVANNVEGPLFIRLGNRGRAYDAPTEQIYATDAKSEGVPPGIVRDIHISNLKATVVSDDPKRCGIMISGIPGHYIEDVLLENIEISFPGGGTAEDAARVVPEREAQYPEAFFFGTLPAWGAYIRHARNVEFRNVRLSARAPDLRERVILEDVQDFTQR
ncbi:glycosyl hydrolase family 28 protein [Pelagicoccus sp. SDUM812005]|uniref:glycoside hydrolase family 28 protein n=1 Tax=Pelagicoccus sp. SDUM812005 TaxID=3041257 RepID=UPI00280EB21D|nr:glycosyl hydrolase family 28 protein [Pelagicoccus sp. SDUM812005]MDQ8183297.1 glycosyl hydrolase family 28 protein [Pelagicoccus sp. SDUM812005]